MRGFGLRLVTHPISAIGIVVAVASGCVFVGLAVLHLFGAPANPYADIVVFVMLPAVFAAGLLLVPVGFWLQRRRPRVAAAST